MPGRGKSKLYLNPLRLHRGTPVQTGEQEERNRAVLVRNDADRRLQRWRTKGKQVDLCRSGGLHSSEECETATAGVWTQTGCHIITTHGPPNHLRTNGHKNPKVLSAIGANLPL